MSKFAFYQVGVLLNGRLAYLPVSCVVRPRLSIDTMLHLKLRDPVVTVRTTLYHNSCHLSFLAKTCLDPAAGGCETLHWPKYQGVLERSVVVSFLLTISDWLPTAVSVQAGFVGGEAAHG